MSTHTIAPDPEVNVGPNSVPDPIKTPVRNEMTEQKIAPVLSEDDIGGLTTRAIDGGWTFAHAMRKAEQAVLAKQGAVRDQMPTEWVQKGLDLAEQLGAQQHGTAWVAMYDHLMSAPDAIRALKSTPAPAAAPVATREMRDVKQLADWLLVTPTTGDRLAFAGPPEQMGRFSKVKMRSADGSDWTLTAGLSEGWLTEDERAANFAQVVKLELSAAPQLSGNPGQVADAQPVACDCKVEDVRIDRMVAKAWDRFQVALAVDDIGNRFSDEQGNIPQDSWDDFARAILAIVATQPAAQPSSQAQPSALVPGTPPRIWLVVGDDGDEPAHFDDMEEVTWCAHPQGAGDIEYVLAQPSGNAGELDKYSDLQRVHAEAAQRIDEIVRHQMTKFGLLVRAMRITVGSTLYAMAKELGVSTATMSGMETGRKPVGPETVREVAAFFRARGLPDVENLLAIAASKEGASHD